MKSKSLGGIACLFLAAACSGTSNTPVDGGTDAGLPVHSCDVTLSFKPTTSVSVVQAGGEWNQFTPASTPMTADKSGTYSATLTLPAGTYAYKIVTDGTWQLDPGQPLRKYVDGTENSALVVPDCRQPTLDSQTMSTTPQGRVRLVAQYTDGSDKAGLASSTATLDGTMVALDVTADGVFTVDQTGIAKGKHRLKLTATDGAGRTAILQAPFWIEDQPFSYTDGVLYFAFTDRFQNGDPTNDAKVTGVDDRANYLGGDFAGITKAINDGWFDSLGVRTIWISPPQPNPDDAWVGTGGYMYTGYHGYWPIDGRTTQKRFGSLDDLKTLVKTAHSHGMRVLVDSVLNHVHQEHPYWLQNRYAGWFNGDGSCVCGGTNCDWNTFALVCWFTPYLPDLNYGDYDAVTAMIDDALFWADEVDVDGFRVDAVKHFLSPAVRLLREELRRRFEHQGPLYYLVGETFTGGGDSDRQFIASFLGPDTLDAQFDFPFYWNTLGALGTFTQSMRDIEATCGSGDMEYHGAPMSPFFGNHDVPRFVSQAEGVIAADTTTQAWTAPPAAPSTSLPYERLRMALTLLLTQPGVPLIYYGDEYGQPGTGDPDNRRFMKWTGYSTDEQATLDHARTVGKLRGTLPALQRGTRSTLWIDDNVYIYVRAIGSDVALVGINRADTAFTQSVPMPATLVPVSDGTALSDKLGGAGITVSGSAAQITIQPRSSAVWTP
jgi:glycosidase